MFLLGILTLIISICCYYIFNHLYFISYNLISFNHIYYKLSNQQFNIFVENNIESSLWCSTNLEDHKTCEFQNLCYLAMSENQFLFVHTNKSVIAGLQSKKQLKSISLSSVSNHNGFFLKLALVNSHKDLLVNSVINNDKILIMWRFKWDNFMHVIHDDLIPIYMTYRDVCRGNIDKCVSKYRLGFLDGGKIGPFSDWYKIFSNKEPLILNEEDTTMCFQSGRIGLSVDSVWYQYGFQQVHGPTNTEMNGNLLEEFTNYVLQKFKINVEKYNLDNPVSIGILFSRKINRKIINENYIIQEMKNAYKKNFPNKTLDVYNLDLSQNDTFSILSLIVKANIVVGMHGSIMLMSMFLPSSASIVELFPFGIQPEFVSPVRAMCNLPAVYQHYISWTNQKEVNSITYPNNPPLLGGISHLSVKEQEDIIKIKSVPPVECCHHPLYLYRMFQDTIVDNSFSKIINSVFRAQKTNIFNYQNQFTSNKNSFDYWFFPSAVTNISCVNTSQDLTISWNKPLNVGSQTVEYNLAIKLDDHEISLTTLATTTNIKITFMKNTVVHIWIKNRVDSNESVDNYLKCDIKI